MKTVILIERTPFLAILNLLVLSCLIGCASVPSVSSSLPPDSVRVVFGPKKWVPGFRWLDKSGCEEGRLCVSAKICTDNICETVRNLVVDTGSTGLRIRRAALSAKFRKVLFTDKHQKQKESLTVFKCAAFGTKSSFSTIGNQSLCGTTAKLELTLGSMQPKHVIAEIYQEKNSTLQLQTGAGQANGILGVAQDQEQFGLLLTPIFSAKTIFSLDHRFLRVLPSGTPYPDLSKGCQSRTIFDTGTDSVFVGVDDIWSKYSGIVGLRALKSMAIFYPDVTVVGSEKFFKGVCPRNKVYTISTKILKVSATKKEDQK